MVLAALSFGAFAERSDCGDAGRVVFVAVGRHPDESGGRRRRSHHAEEVHETGPGGRVVGVVEPVPQERLHVDAVCRPGPQRQPP